MHVVAQFHRFFKDFRFLEHFFAALSAPDRLLAVEAPEFLDDLLLVADLGLVIHIGVVLLLTQRFFALGVSGIIAPEHHAAAVLKLDDLADGPVEKVAVMGDDQYSAFIIHKVCLEPADTVHIQMVRGLVQNQQVRLLQKKFAQRHTGLLSAGESGHLLVQIHRGKAETFEDAQDFSLVGITVFAFKAVEQICVFRNSHSQGFSLQDFHLLLIFREFLLHVDQILLDREHFFIYGALGGEPLVLGKITVTAVSLKGNGTFISAFLADDDPEKSRLSGAVYADHGSFVPSFKVKGNISENHVFRVFFTDMMTR